MRRSHWIRVAVFAGGTAGGGAGVVLSACSVGAVAAPSSLVIGPPDEAAAPTCLDSVPPDAGRVHVTGTVVEARDDDAGGPEIGLPNAMVAVEYGGLYLPWCDLSKASPYYVYGAVTDATGKFEIDVVPGSLGFHSFADGHFYTRAALDTSVGLTVVLTMEKLQPGQAQPTFTNAAFDKATVNAGETVTFAASVATESKDDPLSDENLLVEGTHSFCAELDPPALGKKDDFPDGVWKRSFPAPTEPGTYTYWFSATTSTCVTSNLLRTTLTVR